MKLQYIHKIEYENPRTFVFALPNYYQVEAEVIKSVLESGYRSSLSFKMGIAKLHPDDQYVKTVGRKIAEDKMVLCNFEVHQMDTKSNTDEIRLRLYLLESNTFVFMVMNKGYKRIRILDVW